MATYYLSGATNETYSSDAVEYITQQEGFITEASAVAGVSAGAIAGAMAEENAAYDWKDQILDRYAVLAIGQDLGLTPLDLIKLALNQGFEQANEWLLTYLPSVATGNSHELWLADYEVVEQAVDVNPGILDKLRHPTLIDAGHGNIKIATAIRLVNKYANDYPELGSLGFHRQAGGPGSQAQGQPDQISRCVRTEQQTPCRGDACQTG
jgi:hypothetical protein